MDNNAHSLTLKGLFNITTIVLWTQSPNATPGPCQHNVTGHHCSPNATQTAAVTQVPRTGRVDQLLGDLGYATKPIHVINHGQTSYPRVPDNDLLNYESVISRVPPLLDIVAAHTPLLPTTTSTTIPQITSLIHAAVASSANLTEVDSSTALPYTPKELNNYWALLALILVVGTAAGNILVCLAITWERRLQNVTNYFLMSLAITDLMVAILVMPLGILTLVHGKCQSHHHQSPHQHSCTDRKNDYLWHTKLTCCIIYPTQPCPHKLTKYSQKNIHQPQQHRRIESSRVPLGELQHWIDIIICIF